MYKSYQDGIVEGTESFAMSAVISENVLYLALWALAGYLLWPVWLPNGIPLLTAVWALLVVVIQVVLKKHNCSGCYYYGKMCHLGWGKISAAMFEQDCGNMETGKKLTLFYIVSPPVILLTSLIFAVLASPGRVYWTGLILYIVLNAISFPIRKKGCGVCRMRKVCPGSAAKN